jgi:hypothetical protein
MSNKANDPWTRNTEDILAGYSVYPGALNLVRSGRDFRGDWMWKDCFGGYNGLRWEI